VENSDLRSEFFPGEKPWVLRPPSPFIPSHRMEHSGFFP
jgi:hypothetical protein